MSRELDPKDLLFAEGYSNTMAATAAKDLVSAATTLDRAHQEDHPGHYLQMLRGDHAAAAYNLRLAILHDIESILGPLSDLELAAVELIRARVRAERQSHQPYAKSNRALRDAEKAVIEAARGTP